MGRIMDKDKVDEESHSLSHSRKVPPILVLMMFHRSDAILVVDTHYCRPK